MAHISGLTSKMEQEIVATPLSIQQLRDSVSDIARFLASVGRGPFSVEYGWGCNLPTNDLWHPIEITPAQLEEFVERSENEGSFKLGACDLIIGDQAARFSFIICHESDLHFTSSDRDLQEQVSTLWREKGFTVYVSPYDVKGHRDWKRIDQQVT